MLTAFVFSSDMAVNCKWLSWTTKNYSIAEIIESFDFPLIVKVQGGYCGDTDFESISADEVN